MIALDAAYAHCIDTCPHKQEGGIVGNFSQPAQGWLANFLEIEFLGGYQTQLKHQRPEKISLRGPITKNNAFLIQRFQHPMCSGTLEAQMIGHIDESEPTVLMSGHQPEDGNDAPCRLCACRRLLRPDGSRRSK